MKSLDNYILCPKCKAQYTLGEIFYPQSFFGNEKEVVKSPTGEIDGIIGQQSDMEETYVCDFCYSPFKVVADVKFETKQIDINDKN